MSAVIAALPDLADVAGEDPQAGVGVNPANGEAIILRPELGYIVLAFWLVVPLLIGYYQIQRRHVIPNYSYLWAITAQIPR